MSSTPAVAVGCMSSTVVSNVSYQSSAGSPHSLRDSLLVLGSSLEASLGKLQSQPSTSTCSPSPMKVTKVRVSPEVER